MSDTGTAIMGISVARHEPRKRKTTIATRKAASMSVLRTSPMAERTKRVVSNGMLYSTSGGNCFVSSSSRARMRSAVSSALEPVCRKTRMPATGLPSSMLSCS